MSHLESFTILLWKFITILKRSRDPFLLQPWKYLHGVHFSSPVFNYASNHSSKVKKKYCHLYAEEKNSTDGTTSITS